MRGKNHRENMEIFSILNKNSGRVEKRMCYKILDIDWLACKREWSKFNSIFVVE